MKQIAKHLAFFVMYIYGGAHACNDSDKSKREVRKNSEKGKMNTKRTVLFFLVLYFASFLFESCFMRYLSQKTLIQEEEVTISKTYVIQAYITNCVSDPTYARLYVNDVEVFRCRGGEKIAFEVKDDVLTVYTDGNLKYKYDSIQKESFGELQIRYVQM